ncbi:MAG: hypothetical protein ABSH28_08580 [Acidobacteriota bacterium]|jgi:hypothetical protein
MHKKKGKALFLSSCAAIEDIAGPAEYGPVLSTDNSVLQWLQTLRQLPQTTYKSELTAFRIEA